jgi:N-formylglutamate deformylase
MTASTHLIPGVLLRRDPAAAAPVVFDVPRSGTWYPCDFKPSATFQEVHRSVSMYLGELYDVVPTQGATLLYALFPNAYIDANRHETDVDPELLVDAWAGPGTLAPTVKSKLGIGLIHSLAGNSPLYSEKLTAADVRQRIEGYFLPYHNELARIIETQHAAKKVSYHISCHSMASIGGRSTLDAGTARSEIDIGDLNGKSCSPELTALVARTFSAAGYQVTSNFHYAGAECVTRHGRPSEGRHSLQIEINRKLYMDEQSCTKNEGFGKLQAVIADLAKVLAADLAKR